MVFDNPPKDFMPTLMVVACFIEHEDQVLFVHRSENVSQGGTWAIPGGKVHKDETVEQAIRREIFEECQFELQSPTFIQTVYIRYPDYDYEYHMFKEVVAIKPHIIFDKSEIQNYAWLTREEVALLEEQSKLILDEMPCIERVYAGNFSSNETYADYY